jgi:hypothetical protein
MMAPLKPIPYPTVDAFRPTPRISIGVGRKSEEISSYVSKQNQVVGEAIEMLDHVGAEAKANRKMERMERKNPHGHKSHASFAGIAKDIESMLKSAKGESAADKQKAANKFGMRNAVMALQAKTKENQSGEEKNGKKKDEKVENPWTYYYSSGKPIAVDDQEASNAPDAEILQRNVKNLPEFSPTNRWKRLSEKSRADEVHREIVRARKEVEDQLYVVGKHQRSESRMKAMEKAEIIQSLKEAGLKILPTQSGDLDFAGSVLMSLQSTPTATSPVMLKKVMARKLHDHQEELEAERRSPSPPPASTLPAGDELPPARQLQTAGTVDSIVFDELPPPSTPEAPEQGGGEMRMEEEMAGENQADVSDESQKDVAVPLSQDQNDNSTPSDVQESTDDDDVKSHEQGESEEREENEEVKEEVKVEGDLPLDEGSDNHIPGPETSDSNTPLPAASDEVTAED